MCIMYLHRLLRVDVERTKPSSHFRRQAAASQPRRISADRVEERLDETTTLVKELKGLVASLRTTQVQNDGAQGQAAKSSWQ